MVAEEAVAVEEIGVPENIESNERNRLGIEANGNELIEQKNQTLNDVKVQAKKEINILDECRATEVSKSRSKKKMKLKRCSPFDFFCTSSEKTQGRENRRRN